MLFSVGLNCNTSVDYLNTRHVYQQRCFCVGGCVVRTEYDTLMMTLRAKDEQAAEMKRARAQLRQELEQFKSNLGLQIQEEQKKMKELEKKQRVSREFSPACIFVTTEKVPFKCSE